ncbi:MAG: Spore coat protein CotH [Verrucomicrobiales bacterium]|nr:Spore coat protein CotH [Verrucomicrobiales bacterium]
MKPLRHPRRGGALLLSSALIFLPAHSSRAALKISEFLASNTQGIRDAEGDRNDWIEILNPDAAPAVLTGYYLTDDATKPKKWPFPAVTLPSGGTLLVWASEKDRRVAGEELHTNFKLSSAGEYLALRKDDPAIAGGTLVEHEYAPAYPAQYADLSYGLAQQNSTVVPITTGTAAKRFTPSSDVLDVKEGLNPATWIATAFNDAAWTSCTVPVGYGRDASDAYDLLVTPGSSSDTEAAMFTGAKISCYLRVPFTVANPGAVQAVTLRMKADDGFAAYLNGVPAPVADEVVPDALLWDTPSRWEPTDAESLTWKVYSIPVSRLQTGTNVLSIHGVNASASNNDFLLLPELTLTTSDASLTGAIQYFRQPSPGTPNFNGIANPGPVISGVPQTLPPPVTTAGTVTLPITATIQSTAFPLGSASLKWRVGYAAESAVAMKDDGTGGDQIAGDGLHTGVITIPSLAAGAMVRWRVTATDTAPAPVTTTDPPYPDPADSPQYWGTIGAAPLTASSQLPVLHWFTANAGGAGTSAGSVGSIFYNGEFYDNVRFSLHGQSTAAFAKKSHDIDFNQGFKFRYNAGEKRVKDVNLLSNWADKSKVRTTLAYETHRLAGQPALFAFPVRVQQNGAFFSIADMVEEANDDFLERNNLDPDGALYKMYNVLDSATNGIEKKTRTWEGNTDLNTLIAQLNPGNVITTRRRWGYDNVDIPNLINYLAVTALIMNFDQGHKNYYLYRDYRDAGEWKVLPWDVDLSFGHTWTSTASPNFGASYFDDHIDSTRNIRIGALNRIKSLVYDAPELNKLFVRRLRTLMDHYFVSRTATDGHFESRIAALLDLVDPPGLGTASDAYLDAAKWGFWTMTTNTGAGNSAVNRTVTDALWPSYTPRQMARRITDPTANIAPYPFSTAYTGYGGTTDTRPSFLAGRRAALYGGGAAALSGGEAIPAAQVAVPNVGFGAMQVNPGSMGQDREYFTIRNNSGISIDVSGWKVGGGLDYTFPGGTVIPAYTSGTENVGLLFVAKNPRLFRTRTTTPTGNQFCYTVGGYAGQLSARGGPLELRNAAGTFVATTTIPAAPTTLQQSLRIGAIMYAPAGPDSAEFALNPVWKAGDFEYIELVNTGSATLDLGGAAFTAGVGFVFPAGTSLAAGARLIVPASAAAFAARYDVAGTGLPARVAGGFTGDLDNSGERLQLVDAVGEVVLDFRYEDGWYWPATESGRALVFTEPTASTAWSDWGNAGNWSPGASANGSPGIGEAAGPVVYNIWKFDRFAPIQWETTATSGASADPERDGNNNLLEYALNLDPAASDTAIPVTASLVNVGGTDFPALTFRRRVGAADIAYHPETSTDLTAESWQEMTTLHGSPVAAGAEFEEVTYRLTVPVSAVQRRFMRLRISPLRAIP